MRKNFIPRNDAFTCAACSKQVSPAPRTFRNHCPYCFTSKHVDGLVPGDRRSTCGGLMSTIGWEGMDPDKLDLIQQCRQCGLVRRNRSAPDDDKNWLWGIRSEPYRP